MEPDQFGLRLTDMRRTSAGYSRELAAELADHDGVITAHTALRCGLSRAQIKTRLATGEWRRVARGVFRSQSHAYTEAALVRCATAAHGGIADRLTAAWWHGLIAELPTPLTIATRSASPASWSECEVDLLNRRHHVSDEVIVRGLSVTSLALTVLTASVEISDGARVIDRALQQHPVTVADLRAALERNAGLRGFTEVRRLLAIAGGDTESAAERVFVGGLKAEKIDGWVLQYRFRGWPIDVAWPAEKVAVEIDGWAFHRGVVQFERDHRKRNALAADHWIVLSFTWHQLTYELEDCLRQVIAALAERRLGLLG